MNVNKTDNQVTKHVINRHCPNQSRILYLLRSSLKRVGNNLGVLTEKKMIYKNLNEFKNKTAVLSQEISQKQKTNRVLKRVPRYAISNQVPS